jgi:hypothetical protein
MRHAVGRLDGVQNEKGQFGFYTELPENLKAKLHR